MLKKKHVVEIAGIVVIVFLLGTLLNVNLLTVAGKEEEEDGPPTCMLGNMGGITLMTPFF